MDTVNWTVPWYIRSFLIGHCQQRNKSQTSRFKSTLSIKKGSYCQSPEVMRHWIILIILRTLFAQNKTIIIKFYTLTNHSHFLNKCWIFSCLTKKNVIMYFFLSGILPHLLPEPNNLNYFDNFPKIIYFFSGYQNFIVAGLKFKYSCTKKISFSYLSFLI